MSGVFLNVSLEAAAPAPPALREPRLGAHPPLLSEDVQPRAEGKALTLWRRELHRLSSVSAFPPGTALPAGRGVGAPCSSDLHGRAWCFSDCGEAGLVGPEQQCCPGAAGPQQGRPRSAQVPLGNWGAVLSQMGPKEVWSVCPSRQVQSPAPRAHRQNLFFSRAFCLQNSEGPNGGVGAGGKRQQAVLPEALVSQGQLGRSYWGQLAGVECSRKGCRHEGQSPGQAWALAGSSVHPLMAQVPATRWCRMESLQSEDRPGRSEPVLVPGAQGGTTGQSWFTPPGGPSGGGQTDPGGWRSQRAPLHHGEEAVRPLQ